jgi:hypothetical protein
MKKKLIAFVLALGLLAPAVPAVAHGVTPDGCRTYSLHVDLPTWGHSESCTLTVSSGGVVLSWVAQARHYFRATTSSPWYYMHTTSWHS